VDERGSRRYDWAAIQRYYDAGNSVRDCIAQFGFSRQTWHAAVKRGAIVPRPHAMPMARLLVADTYRSRHNVKLRLLGEGLKVNRCEACGLTEWRGASLSMALHHANGDGRDNRLENLQLLCPNCHSQTENFAGRGRRRLEAV
jgi:5-methylcytosine-specific restriction endonuclease McrA